MLQPAIRALEAIDEIDSLAELIRQTMFADPMEAAKALGRLRSTLTWLRCDVRTVSEICDLRSVVNERPRVVRELSTERAISGDYEDDVMAEQGIYFQP